MTPDLLESSAPSCVEFTIFDDPANNRYLLHIVNELDIREPLPIYDFDVTVKMPQAAASVRSILGKQEFACWKDGERLTIHVDRLDMAEHLLIPYEA